MISKSRVIFSSLIIAFALLVVSIAPSTANAQSVASPQENIGPTQAHHHWFWPFHKSNSLTSKSQAYQTYHEKYQVYPHHWYQHLNPFRSKLKTGTVHIYETQAQYDAAHGFKEIDTNSH